MGLFRKKNAKGIITKSHNDFCIENNDRIRWFHDYFSYKNSPTNLNSSLSKITTSKKESCLEGFKNLNNN